MKTIKLFTAVSLLTLSSLSAFSITPQIYDLKVSVRNDSIFATFMSSYNLTSATQITIDCFDSNFNKAYVYLGAPLFTPSKEFVVESKPYKFGYKFMQDSISEITFRADFKQFVSKYTMMNFSLYSKTGLRSTSAVNYSNYLSYTYDPSKVTAINDVITDTEIVDTRYFNLQGVEVGVAPIGMPYVEVQTDINGKKSVKKKLIQQ